MDDPVDLEDRIGMRGRVGRLEAPSLVDGDIHQNRPRLQRAEHVAGDQLRRQRAGNKDRADDQVSPFDRVLDR